jgi:hypothetical protein
MKSIFVLYLTIIILKFIKCGKQSQYSARFRSIECDANNKTAIVEYCFIKAVSRQHATLNVKIHFTEPISAPVYVHLILYYRYGNIYREVIDTKKIDWCPIMDGMNAHLFLMQILKLIRPIAGTGLQTCPYKFDIELKNITLDTTRAMDVFPEGTYKFTWITYVKKNFELLWKFNTTLNIKSPLKESMGK